MSIREEVEGLNESQAIRHLALAMDATRDEVKSIRGLLTTIGLLLFGALVSLIGVFLAIILKP